EEVLCLPALRSAVERCSLLCRKRFEIRRTVSRPNPHLYLDELGFTHSLAHGLRHCRGHETLFRIRSLSSRRFCSTPVGTAASETVQCSGPTFCRSDSSHR